MQIHEMTMADGVMKMRELPDGLRIPSGHAVMLEPGGYHVMFMDLKEPLVQGAKVDVTLRFAKAGEVPVTLVVLAPDANGFPEHGK
jgi:copper(I)-binding protein